MANNMSIFQTCSVQECNNSADTRCSCNNYFCNSHSELHRSTCEREQTRICIDLPERETQFLDYLEYSELENPIKREISQMNDRVSVLLRQIDEIQVETRKKLENLHMKLFTVRSALKEVKTYRKVPLVSYNSFAKSLGQLKERGNFTPIQIQELIKNFANGLTSEIIPEAIQLCSTLSGHSEQVLSVAISPCGQFIASASRDKTIKIWFDSTNTASLKGHTSDVSSIDFHPNGPYLVSGGHDMMIKLWAYREGICISDCEKKHKIKITCVKYSPGGDFIASASEDQHIGLWDANGRFIDINRIHSNGVMSIAFSEDGKYILSGSTDKNIGISKVDGLMLERTIPAHDSPISAIAVYRNLVISGGIENIKCFDWNTGRCLYTINNIQRVKGLCFSDNGKFYASASGEINLWGESNYNIKETGRTIANAIAMKGNVMVTGHRNNSVLVWKLR